MSTKTYYICMVILAFVSIIIALFSGYVFYFADCSMAKQYWYIVQTPGRCI